MSRLLLALAAVLPLAVQAQPSAAWQACTAIGDAAQRLACFDRWAETENRPAQRAAPSTPAGAPAPAPAVAAAPPRPEATNRRVVRMTTSEGCHDSHYSALSRFWELEPGADCGTFGLRGYRPISLDLAFANSVNREPTSGDPLNDATTPLDYQTHELRLQLSVRTKLAQNLLTLGSQKESDSLWFGYTQQSYWQLFNPGLSRPFRSTDHEPELIYIHPLQSANPSEWRLRFGGIGVVHQSNGQSLPLSRSWNRAYLMLGAERGDFEVTGRVWRRLPEGGSDDNPGIGDYIGRGEIRAAWQASHRNRFAVTGRSALRSPGRGSLRLEWFRTLWDDGEGPPGGLQLHTEIFSGYGDTLLDYNRQRTVFSVGFSLADW